MAEGTAKDRHLMVAVDAPEQAQKAVMYVADMLGGLPGFRLTLVRLIPVPPEEFLEQEGGEGPWMERAKKEAEELLGRLREVCVQAGFEPGKVLTNVVARRCASVSTCLLQEAEALGVCTIVVGRRGLSEREEFLFGSTSSGVLHKARGCSVWVVE